jgi:hypothetical protein
MKRVQPQWWHRIEFGLARHKSVHAHGMPLKALPSAGDATAPGSLGCPAARNLFGRPAIDGPSLVILI